MARNANRGADAVSLAAGSSALASSDGSGFRSGPRPQSLASRSGADSTLPAEAAAPENPLAHLLAGMNVVALNGQQLAIAAVPNNSSLLLLGADRSYSTIAEIPSLRLASNLQPNTSATSTPAGLAG